MATKAKKPARQELVCTGPFGEALLKELDQQANKLQHNTFTFWTQKLREAVAAGDIHVAVWLAHRIGHFKGASWGFATGSATGLENRKVFEKDTRRLAGHGAYCQEHTEKRRAALDDLQTYLRENPGCKKTSADKAIAKKHRVSASTIQKWRIADMQG